jgi:hypothetical protein
MTVTSRARTGSGRRPRRVRASQQRRDGAHRHRVRPCYALVAPQAFEQAAVAAVVGQDGPNAPRRLECGGFGRIHRHFSHSVARLQAGHGGLGDVGRHFFERGEVDIASAGLAKPTRVEDRVGYQFLVGRALLLRQRSPGLTDHRSRPEQDDMPSRWATTDPSLQNHQNRRPH